MKLKTNDLFVYGVAGLSAVLAVVMVYGYVQNRVAEAETRTEVKTVTVVEKPQMRSVVIASRDLYRGEKLEADDIKVLNVPTDGLVVNGVVVNPQTVLGRIANQKIYAGEWLLDQKFGHEQVAEKNNVESLLEVGHRAMRLPVSAETGLLGILNPGDHVDIVSVFESADSKRMISRVVLQNIPVLSIGQNNRMKNSDIFLGKSQQEAMDAELTHNETQVASSMVALDVETGQAEQLALAMNVGSIHLILRNQVDTEIVQTEGVSLKVMEGSNQRPPKYKAKDKREVIELMQGESIEKVRTR